MTPDDRATTTPAPPDAATGDDVTPAARLTGVEVTFAPKGSKGPTTTALTGIDLDIAAGGFVTLLGPSGCGKSTLLRVLADLVEPTAGTAEVLGGPPHDARLGRRYGFAFQQATLFEWRTVQRNIELPLALAGMSKRERGRRATEMLELVGLADFADHRPSQLSGGMQQRVAIARALSFEPELLLMDEPFGALDEMTREHLQGELLRIWRETGTTVVFVTHSIAEAVFLSTKVVVLTPRPGRIHSVVDIPLGAERTMDTRESPEYYELVNEVRERLRAEGAL
ncbi:MAG: ABC transporter ATP-binding protein [Actinomycetota bacterium]|nr:ABC transporter ATP-binding protein [Actinomycetota bacterium]